MNKKTNTRLELLYFTKKIPQEAAERFALDIATKKGYSDVVLIHGARVEVSKDIENHPVIVQLLEDIETGKSEKQWEFLLISERNLTYGKN